MTSSCVLQRAPVENLQLLSIIKDTSVSPRQDLRGVYMLTDVSTGGCHRSLSPKSQRTPVCRREIAHYLQPPLNDTEFQEWSSWKGFFSLLALQQLLTGAISSRSRGSAAPLRAAPPVIRMALNACLCSLPSRTERANKHTVELLETLESPSAFLWASPPCWAASRHRNVQMVMMMVAHTETHTHARTETHTIALYIETITQ